jgi:hypothetical protein
MAQGQLRISLVQLSTCLVQVRTPLDMRRSLLRTRLRCCEGGGLGRATTSLLLLSLQIQSLNQLLNQSVRGNHLLYSQSMQVNAVLGNLVRMHYPSEVTRSDDTISPATCWDDYALALDAMYETAKGAVWSDFWVSFSVILFLKFYP